MARIIGLVNVELSDIAGDGGFGTSFSAIGNTVKDSMVMTESDPTKQEFFEEETDDPIESQITQKGIETLAWSTFNTSAGNMKRLFGGTAVLFKSIATFGAVTGGSAYTNGTYVNVPLTGGAGTGARATIVVAGGVVTTVTLTDGGEGYAVANSLSAAQSSIGGTGTGFAVPVATLANASATRSLYQPPATSLEVEQSIRVTDRKGNILRVVRAKLSAKKNISFQSTKLGQIDITATILTPNKANTPKYEFDYQPGS